jgi:6-phosphogluconolactonase
VPIFDSILLGMGPDGHTASLFPGTPAVAETQRWVVANPVPALGVTRLTFTLPVLNAASHVMFLVVGADKAARLHEVLSGPPSAALPAGLVRPAAGGPEWLVDAPAAAMIGGLA